MQTASAAAAMSEAARIETEEIIALSHGRVFRRPRGSCDQGRAMLGKI
jgi:hypothetical protein